MGDTVIVKLQRPLYTTGSHTEVLSYIVDEDGERISNPHIQKMKKRDIKKLFGDCCKVYYLGVHTDGEPIELQDNAPVWQGDWV